MALELRKAQRSKAYLKLGMSAPSGGGKTLGALIIAYGLMREKYLDLPDEELWSKIVVIDTEHGSGELYVGWNELETRLQKSSFKIGEYSVIPLTEPYTTEKYMEAIELAENPEYGLEVCIIDSTTHAWSGEGGLLEQQGNIAKKIGNSYAAWRDITPKHNDFVTKMLHSPLHIIATMRSKQEYVQEKDDRGKTTIRKVGLEPEQRKGMEYEFTAFFEIDAEHGTFGSKDRTSLFDQKHFTITPEVGKKYMQWLSEGTNAEKEVLAVKQITDANESIDQVKQNIIRLAKKLGGSSNEELMSVIKEYAPSGNPNEMTKIEKVRELRSELQGMVDNLE
jgi:hypothetical protein